MIYSKKAHRRKTVYMYDAKTYELVGTYPSVGETEHVLGNKFGLAHRYPQGYIIEGIIYATIQCPYTDKDAVASYFSTDNDYIGIYRDKKQTAQELRGVKVYIYDAEDMSYLGYYNSVADASFDMDVPMSTLIAGTRKHPTGYAYGATVFSRVKLHEGDI